MNYTKKCWKLIGFRETCVTFFCTWTYRLGEVSKKPSEPLPTLDEHHGSTWSFKSLPSLWQYSTFISRSGWNHKWEKWWYWRKWWKDVLLYFLWKPRVRSEEMHRVSGCVVLQKRVSEAALEGTQGCVQEVRLRYSSWGSCTETWSLLYLLLLMKTPLAQKRSENVSWERS